MSTTRHAPDKSTAQLHAEVAKGAIEDAGLTKAEKVKVVFKPTGGAPLPFFTPV
jgi:hypothetical protein